MIIGHELHNQNYQQIVMYYNIKILMVLKSVEMFRIKLLNDISKSQAFNKS